MGSVKKLTVYMLNINNSNSSSSNDEQLLVILNKSEKVGKAQCYVLAFFFVRPT